MGVGNLQCLAKRQEVQWIRNKNPDGGVVWSPPTPIMDRKTLVQIMEDLTNGNSN